jgi:uncharacterized protein
MSYPRHVLIGGAIGTILLLAAAVGLSSAQVNVSALKAKAENGDAEAQYFLGVFYNEGQGVQPNAAEALKWFRKAAKQGNVDAQFDLGALLSGEPFYVDAGVKQDYGEAAKWYRKAAEQGDAEAQFVLAGLYDRGKGVPLDYAEAAYWYRNAAAQGLDFAQCNLGILYEFGKGVPRDYAEAAKWYRKAGEQGVPIALERLVLLFESASEAPRDDSELVAWYRKAAENAHGCTPAYYTLGRFYRYGLHGVTKDDAEAARWLRPAAEWCGNAAAQYELGALYYSGSGVPRNDVEAYYLLTLASDSGERRAAMLRDQVRRHLTPQEISDARKRATEWRPIREPDQDFDSLLHPPSGY